MKRWNIEPPSSPETEEAVLGAILLNNELMSELSIKPENFYVPGNRAIFDVMKQLYRDKSVIDVVTIGRVLGKKGIKQVGGVMYLSGLVDKCVSSSNASHYAKILADMSKRREMIKVCMDIATNGSEQNVSISEYLSVSRNSLINLIDDTDDLSESVTATESVVEAYQQAITEGEPKGLVKTGIGKIDDRFGGLWPGLLTVLASRPSMGKSCFALNLVANACLKGKKVLLLSLEDTRTFVHWRMLSRFADVSIDKIIKRQLTEKDKLELEKAHNIIKCFELRLIDKGGMTSEKIKSTCISHANKFGVDLVVIDHLGHINEPGKSLYESTSNAARTIASIPPELNVPVLLLHQLNRAPESREDPTPKLSDLRQSGEIEQLARAVWFLYRPGYYQETADPNELALIVAKNSHGPTNMLKLWCDMPRMFVTDNGGKEW